MTQVKFVKLYGYHADTCMMNEMMKWNRKGEERQNGNKGFTRHLCVYLST